MKISGTVPGNGFQQVSDGPAGLFPFDSQTVFARGPVFEEIEGDPLDHGHVAGTIGGTEARGVIAKDDIQDPVERVLDPPYKVPLII